MIPFRSTLNSRFTPPPTRQRPGGMVGNPFGVNMQIPGVPQQPPVVQPQNQFNMNPQVPIQPQAGQQPVDFAAEYAKLNENRPNRLAYQQSIEQGSPEIKRGKLAKLGALIAAAGGSMGYGNQPGGAQAGANLGLSSYYAPQTRADEAYEKKQKGLGNLASMEEQDIANQIKALEAKQQDYYRNREDVRQQTESERQGEESKARLASIQDEMDRRDIAVYQDAETGITYRKNTKTGVATPIGKTGLTQAEKIELARQEEEAKEKVREPGQAADRASREKIANIGYDKTVDSAKIRADQARTTAAQRLAAAAKQQKPGDVYGNVLNAMSEAVAADDLSAEAAALIRKNEALGNLEVASAGYLGDKKAEREAKAWLAEEMERQRNTPATAAPAAPNAGTTTTGRKYQVTPVGGGGR